MEGLSLADAAAPPDCRARHVIIVGGGASGVLAALHLLRDPGSRILVTMVEQRSEAGTGVAYSTSNPDHLLNVRAANMSAYPDDPQHFWRWLVLRGQADDPACSDPYCFVPRRIFGRYLQEEIGRHAKLQDRASRFELVLATCVAVREETAGVRITLRDGRTLRGDLAVLATGLEHTRLLSDVPTLDPWDASRQARLPRNASVMIVGTGLTMVDYLLSLRSHGHEGPVFAISRRGLLSHPHRHVGVATLDVIEIPFGASIGRLCRWLRAMVLEHVRAGGDWRGAVDALRPYTQLLWQRLPPASRSSFLRHALPWWSVHRHRMAPEVHTRMRAAIAQGQLRIIAGKLVSAEPRGDALQVTFRRRGQAAREALDVAALVDCQGRSLTGTASLNPVIADLLASGLARQDAMGLGLEVRHDGALLRTDGRPSERLFAVGPLTRGTFWESVAIPDIARQCASLGQRLAATAVAA